MELAEWLALLEAVQEIQGWFPEGAVFIGGIAVYAYATSHEATAPLAAMTHDADFMIAISDYADLRDIEVVTTNRRLGRHQFIKNDIEFDVYVQGQNDLAVPVDEALAHSRVVSGVRVVCPEHLVVLKMKAYDDRKGTPKGDKDEDDILRVLLATDSFNPEPLARLTDEMLADVAKIVEGDGPKRLCKGNLHLAKTLRTQTQGKLLLLEAAHKQNYSDGAAP